ncbi:hypothetical protein AB835_02885 [Candidatus Endobugula sertula]|uniref:SSD domain-containing protein n=1 Tax=Candidatus Endobugula sertula TaxID=62101 RepID=A0A1D2QSI1_9GAMM|nr:hypothetical protein AB835_02885 [Candidatus Endobugula sertula]
MLHVLQSFYFNSILKKPLWVMGFIVILAIVLATQLGNLKIDASSDALTLEYDKDLDYFREVTKRYQSGNFLVITYKPDGDLLSDESLEHLKALRDELKILDGVSTVYSILDVPLLYSPKVSLSDISQGIKTLSHKGVDRQLAAKELSNSPIYKNMLLGPDGKTTAILLNLDVDEKFIRLVRERDALRLKASTGELPEDEVQRLMAVSEEFFVYRTQVAAKNYQRVQAVRAIVESYRDRAELFLGGTDMITADMVDFIRSDMVVFGVGILLLIIAILWFIFRHWQFVLLPMTSCFLSATIMLGLLAAIDWRLTVISSNFVALLLIIGLALTIHLIVRYWESAADQPEASNEWLVEQMVCLMIKPCVYTVLTTMVAFVSLVVSGIRPVIDFGWMMTLGLLISFVVAFLIIPSGLILLPKAAIKMSRDNSRAFTVVFSRFTERYGSVVIMSGLVAAVVSIIGVSYLKVENRFIDYFHSSTEIYQGMLVIDQQLGGTITLDIILDRSRQSKPESFGGVDSDEANPFGNEGDPFADNVDVEDPFADDPFADDDSISPDPYSSYWFTRAGLETISQLHHYLDNLPEVGKVQSLATAYQTASDLNGGQLNDFELAIVRRLLPDNITDFLITPYLASDLEQTRITMRIRETDPNLRRAELLDKIRHYVINDMGIPEDSVHITGLLVLYNNMLQSLFTSQILTIGAVFLGILMMFLVLFRSLYLSLIALAPNMLAALVVLGGMGLAGIPLDMMTITIAAIAVGIGVDDAIHYIYRFRNEFAKDKNYINTMHRSHASIGRSMYYTSVTVIMGFSILALSKFIPSIYFGLLTGLAMLAAIVASLTLLPKLMLLLQPLGRETD